MRSDLINRQAAIAVADASDYVGLSVEDVKKVTDEVVKGLKRLPSAQPEITLESAVDYLHSIGWMQEHDRKMYDMGLKEQLADDSGSYDSLIPCAEPEPCDFCANRDDCDDMRIYCPARPVERQTEREGE